MKSSNQERSADYLPSIWDPQFLIDLPTSFTYEEAHGTRLEMLKEEVRRLIASTTSMGDPRDLLKLIDTIQRLGVAYHFEKEIEAALHHLYSYIPTDLYHTSLYFRLLRSNGFSINSDAFKKFVDKDGKFMNNLREDVRGLLSLYEAAHLGIPGEDILEEAKKFSTNHLKFLTTKLESDDLAEQIKESLAIPLHWRMPRWVARNFIDTYQKDDAKNSVLLEHAKLDFNIVQSIHLKELKELAGWLKELNFNKKPPFNRDRLVESYIWAMGSIPEPHFSKSRKNIAKHGTILTFVNYVYDVYAPIDELAKLTEAFDRWDVKAVEELPEYMKICFINSHNTVKDASEDLGLHVVPYLKDSWITYCKETFKETKWNESGYVPSFDEHLKGAWITSGVLGGLVISYFGIGDSIAEYLPHCVANWFNSDLFYSTSLLGRLINDLKSYKMEMERGDLVNLIGCYKKEHGVSEEEAQDRVKDLIYYSWKKLNELAVRNSYPPRILKLAMDMARCLHSMYRKDDFFGIQSQTNIDFVSKLLFESIPME